MSMFNINSASFHQVYVSGAIDLTGSINLTGSLLIDGKKIENILSNATPYGMLQYKYSEPDTSSIYGWDRYAGRYQFTFDSGNFWTGSKTTRVQMSVVNWPTEFDPDYPNVNPYGSLNYSGNFINYLSKMVEIIKLNQINTTLNFTSVKYPGTKKVFKIKDVKFYTPTFTGSNTFEYNANEWNLDSYRLTWGMGDSITEYTDASFPTYFYNGIELPSLDWHEKYSIFDDPTQWEYAIDALSMQRQRINPSLFYPGYDPENVNTVVNFEVFSQYDLEVEEIYSSTDSNDPAFSPTDPIPLEGDLFHIDFDWTPVEKKKKIYFVTGSTDITVPDWVNSINIVCVGAGGGGGGGASGYAHTGSAPFLDELQDYRDVFINAIDGTAGNYTPRQDTWFGHEFVTGGGGGAGGCVSIETITGNDAISARNTPLSLTIGSGGLGGSGSSYLNDIVALQEANPLNDFYPEYRAWKVLEEIMNGPLGLTSFPGIAFKQGAVAIISPYGELYNGKPGGDTIAVLNNKIVTRAQGGNGGAAGFALKKYFSPFHRLSESALTKSTGFAFVPGGANDGTTNVGSEIRIGSAGGYGMSMPTAIKKLNTTKNPVKPYPIIDKFSFKAANAPNFEFGNFDTNETAVDAWRLPYANIKRFVNVGDEHLKYKKTGYLISDKSVPLGGGGGVGASYEGIDQRPVSVYTSDIIRYGFDKLYGMPYTIPDDYFQYTSNIISSSIRLGLGGKTLEEKDPLIDILDDVGIRHKWEFSNQFSGGHGGYGSYGLWVDTSGEDPWSFDGNNLENLLPQSGSDFPLSYANAPNYLAQAASGGGGGAGRYVLNYEDKYRTDNESLYPTRGQNGARGGNGFAIVVFEE